MSIEEEIKKLEEITNKLENNTLSLDFISTFPPIIILSYK